MSTDWGLSVAWSGVDAIDQSAIKPAKVKASSNGRPKDSSSRVRSKVAASRTSANLFGSSSSKQIILAMRLLMFGGLTIHRRGAMLAAALSASLIGSPVGG